NVLTCGLDDSVESLMAVMTERRVRHLPVLEEGRLLGIISIGDVVKNRLEEATLVVDSLRDYVTGGR
ncbi:MAG: CBS domain-containing protein, partial [Alphaproteobacteria bacterium]|nr:CBS domain-containing protein [Alphaproteobacteria bacterium]